MATSRLRKLVLLAGFLTSVIALHLALAGCDRAWLLGALWAAGVVSIIGWLMFCPRRHKPSVAGLLPVGGAPPYTPPNNEV